MSKMMTSYLIESKIIKGEISRDDEFLVSEKAWRMQGSKMFVSLGQKIKVLDLLKGVIIQSGNDACVVLAEGTSGSEALFVKEMNEQAQKMGMLNTHFKNSSGWPQEGHYSTARDLAYLGLRVVNDHSEFYKLYSEKTFSYNSIEQGNRNPLLYDNLNCDGIKTGHTDDGGYGMVASFLDGDQRYIMVINGLSTIKDRAHEARNLLGWVKENFIYKPIVKKNQLLEEKILVKNGKKDMLSVASLNDIKVLIPRAQQKNTMKMLFQSIDAPVEVGQIVGKMSLETALGTREFPIVAAESIERLGYFKLVAKQVFSFLFREK
jgi:D-alanyl-D-alanine carboxypeptidase (penicillin-binding protein 5/6)